MAIPLRYAGAEFFFYIFLLTFVISCCMIGMCISGCSADGSAHGSGP